MEANVKWFNKHLNWTWLIALVIGFILAIVVQIIVHTQDPYDPKISGIAHIVFYLVLLVVLIPASVYVVVKKGKSFWLLLLIGWFSPLWLANRELE